MEQDPLVDIYRGVPHNYVDDLMAFRASHPTHTRSVDGVEWTYILCGEGPETVLILGGAMSTAETSRSLILSLEDDYRVLAPGYPAYKTLAAFLDGLVKLLDLERIERVHAYGHSLGAGLCHALIRCHPDRVSKLILSSFGLYNERNLRLTKLFVFLFRLLPYGFVSGYYKRRMPKLLTDLDEGERAFWAAYMTDVLDRQLTKKQLMAQFGLMEDAFRHPDTYGIYEPVAREEVLILQAKDDTGFDPDEQVALQATYPNATVHVFEGGGHLTRTTHEAEYDAVLHRFLASEET